MKYLMIALAALFANECALAQTPATTTNPAATTTPAPVMTAPTITPNKKRDDSRSGNTADGVAAATLMTTEERMAHLSKLRKFTNADECKAYLTDHLAQLAARAKAQGKTLRPPKSDQCKRLETEGATK